MRARLPRRSPPGWVEDARRGGLGAGGARALRGSIRRLPCTDSARAATQFDLSSAQAGLLQSAFLIGLMACSPVFSHLAKTRSALHLIAAGLALWGMAVGAVSLAARYWQLVAARALVGAGEAAIVCLAAPFIDDVAPKERRTVWLGAFYMWISAGMALGYAYGGAAAALSGGNWRWGFRALAAVSLPVVCFCALSKPIPLGVSRRQGGSSSGQGSAGHAQHTSFLRDVWTLLRCAPYACSLVAFALYTGGVGTLAAWGPTAAREAYPAFRAHANIAVAGATAVSGLVGTLSGGVLLDRLGGTPSRAFDVCAASVFAGGLIILGAFVCSEAPAFLFLFCVAMILILLPQAVVNAAHMWTVPLELRSLCMSLAVNIIHAFGDVPMPPLAGVLNDKLKNWRQTMAIMCLLFLPASLFWLGAAALSRRRRRRERCCPSGPDASAA